MQQNNDSKTLIPLKFQCSQCGVCCKRAGKSGFMPDRGDGACIYLTKENTCSIYDTRPELCNMEKMWAKRNKELDLELRGITKKDYFIENSEACNYMMNQDKVDKSFFIDLKKYDEMENQ
jgi:Fe-S-cluster containining protein